VARVQILTTLLILGIGVVLTVKAANQLPSLPGSCRLVYCRA
jgi:hypothetical protein